MELFHAIAIDMFVLQACWGAEWWWAVWAAIEDTVDSTGIYDIILILGLFKVIVLFSHYTNNHLGMFCFQLS